MKTKLFKTLIGLALAGFAGCASLPDNGVRHYRTHDNKWVYCERSNHLPEYSEEIGQMLLDIHYKALSSNGNDYVNSQDLIKDLKKMEEAYKKISDKQKPKYNEKSIINHYKNLNPEMDSYQNEPAFLRDFGNYLEAQGFDPWSTDR